MYQLCINMSIAGGARPPSDGDGELGRKNTPAETIERVAGGPIDPQPYLNYLRDKLGTLAAA